MRFRRDKTEQAPPAQIKQARLTPDSWRAAQILDVGRGRPSKETADATWRMLTAADPALSIEPLLPPESLRCRLTEDEQATTVLTAKRALVVAVATTVAAGRRQAPVSFGFVLDAVARRWSNSYQTAKVARWVRQMGRPSAQAVVREIMEVGIRLDAIWHLTVSGPWSLEAPRQRHDRHGEPIPTHRPQKPRQPKTPLNPLYHTSRVALGPYEVELMSSQALEAFEALIFDDDAYHEVERLSPRRVVFAGAELPPRETRQDVVADWPFNIVPAGVGSARTFAILEKTELQPNVSALEKDLIDAGNLRTQTLNALRRHGIEPAKRSKRTRWDGTSGQSERERQINAASLNDPNKRQELEALTRQYDRADAALGILRPVLAQIKRYHVENSAGPVRIQTQMFRASHGRFYPRSFWPTEGSTRDTPWGDATRPRWFKDRDGRDLIEYDVSASQSQVMGAFLGLPELEAAACATTPRFKDHLAALVWQMVAEKAATPTQPRCTDMLVQFRETDSVPSYGEPKTVDGRVVYDPRLVALVKQAWMTFTYGSPPNEVIKTLRERPDLYGPGFGGEYVQTVTRGPRKGDQRVDGGARALMTFLRALPWFAKTEEYLRECRDISAHVDQYTGFVITDPLDKRPFRWNPVAIRPLDEVKSVGGNRVRLDVACHAWKIKTETEPLRIGHKMETSDGYSWMEYDEIPPRAKSQPKSTYKRAEPNDAGDYAIDRGELRRQIAPQVIHLLDSYFAALVTQNLYRRRVRDMVVVHDAFCVAEKHVDTLQSAIHEASETWFRGLGPVYDSLLAATPRRPAIRLFANARARWADRCQRGDFPHFVALPS
jgi:hypothetical protein